MAANIYERETCLWDTCENILKDKLYRAAWVRLSVGSHDYETRSNARWKYIKVFTDA